MQEREGIADFEEKIITVPPCLSVSICGYLIREQWGQAQVFKYFYQEESHEGQVLTLDIREETGGQDWD